MNIQGLTNNFNELEILTVEGRYEMIVVSETHVVECVKDSEIKLNNYNVIRCNSSSTRTGGVVIYLKESCSFSILKNEQIKMDIWVLVIEVVQMGHIPITSKRSFCDFF